MSAGYRVEWRWLLMGPLLGYFSGFVIVSLLGVLSPPLLLVTVPLGLVLGGPVGAAVGAVAGVPLAFLVGPQLSTRSAVRRATVLGAVVPPVVVLLTLELGPGLPWIGEALTFGSLCLGPLLFASTTILGGIVAARTARIDMPRTAVS